MGEQSSTASSAGTRVPRCGAVGSITTGSRGNRGVTAGSCCISDASRWAVFWHMESWTHWNEDSWSAEVWRNDPNKKDLQPCGFDLLNSIKRQFQPHTKSCQNTKHDASSAAHRVCYLLFLERGRIVNALLVSQFIWDVMPYFGSRYTMYWERNFRMVEHHKTWCCYSFCSRKDTVSVSFPTKTSAFHLRMFMSRQMSSWLTVFDSSFPGPGVPGCAETSWRVCQLLAVLHPMTLGPEGTASPPGIQRRTPSCNGCFCWHMCVLFT